MATATPKPVAKKQKEQKPESSSEPVIVLGPRDALDNMPALVNNKPAYYHRTPEGVWKSSGPQGRRKLGDKMAEQLERVYQSQSAGVIPFSDFQDLQSKEKALNNIGLIVVKSLITAGNSINLKPESPWTEIPFNSLSLNQAITRVIERELSNL